MNGTSAFHSLQIFSAARPLKPGMEKSDSTTSGENACRALRRSASVCTRRAAKSTFARFSSLNAISASWSLSSTSRILIDADIRAPSRI
jgi:hypothetical protein